MLENVTASLVTPYGRYRPIRIPTIIPRIILGIRPIFLILFICTPFRFGKPLHIASNPS